jgi:hypothetical protein
MGGVTLALLALVGCNAFQRSQAPPPAGPQHDAAPPMPIGPPAQAARFVGNAACAECHPEAAEQHAASHHAHTLLPVSDAEALRYFTSTQTLSDRSLGMTYSVERAGRQPIFRVRRGSDGATEELTPDWVIGSGRFGHTFLMEREGRFMESRLSYYPPLKAWGWTPGQQQQTPFRAPLGNVMGEGDTLACFVCHSTFVARDDQVRPEKSLFNVGCERCHGPGREHVESIRAGRGLGSLFTFRDASQATLMQLCGECHRSPGAVAPEELATHPDLPRFAGTALAASACYTKSEGKLSCLTCHSPHARVSTDLAAYDRTCRGCHTGAAASSPACRVNPRSGCVNCHMPAEAAGEPRQLKFRNHWIRIRPAGAGS